MADTIKLELSADELSAIRCALNEVLELVDDWEFEIRLGFTKAEVETLQRRLKQIA